MRACPRLTKSDIMYLMKSGRRKRTAEIIFRDGKPSAVILRIDDYQKMLERLEDIDDLKMLKAMRSKPLKFRSFDEVLKECETDVQNPDRARR